MNNIMIHAIHTKRSVPCTHSYSLLIHHLRHVLILSLTFRTIQISRVTIILLYTERLTEHHDGYPPINTFIILTKHLLKIYFFYILNRYFELL